MSSGHIISRVTILGTGLIGGSFGLALRKYTTSICVSGWDRTDVSWVAKRGGNEVGRRFDHVFASKALRAQTCEYLHEWRERRERDAGASRS